MKTPVEYLAEKYNYITWLRNRDEISPATADEWREKFLKQAKEMEDQQLNKAKEKCEHIWKSGFDHTKGRSFTWCAKCKKRV